MGKYGRQLKGLVVIDGQLCWMMINSTTHHGKNILFTNDNHCLVDLAGLRTWEQVLRFLLKIILDGMA